nr:hypothetical protein [Nocardia sp.]
MRVSDRFETLMRVLAALAVVVAVPISGAIGTVSYTGAQARIVAQDAGKTRVTATLTADAQRLATADRYGAQPDRYQVPVQWMFDAHARTGTIEIPGPQAVGTTTSMWIGPDGNPAIAPARPGSAAAEGVGTGLAILVESWCATAASVWITAAVLDSRRNARWEREWRMLNRPIGKDSL